jgi:hypothetical protein
LLTNLVFGFCFAARVGVATRFPKYEPSEEAFTFLKPQPTQINTILQLVKVDANKLRALLKKCLCIQKDCFWPTTVSWYIIACSL